MKTQETLIPVYSEGMIGDTHIDMSIQCLACVNLNSNMTTCKAFPNGIHIKILTGHFDHTRPYRNDNGIRFKRIEKQ